MQPQTQVSPLRLRIGIFCVFIWWIPIWAAAPLIAQAVGSSDPGRLTIIIMTIQTIIGVIGMLIAGREVSNLVRKMPFKKVPGTIWYVLIHGKTR